MGSGRLLTVVLALVAPISLAAPASAESAQFQRQLLTSSFVGAGKTPHNFEPAIRVGPGDQVYVAANYHNYHVGVAWQTSGPGL